LFIPRQKVSNKLFSHLHFCQAGVEQRLRERRGSCITEKEGQKARLKPCPTLGQEEVKEK